MFLRNKIRSSKTAMVRHFHVKGGILFICYTAKKNERVMADLEEQKAKLHQAKAEYEKLTSSDVR